MISNVKSYTSFMLVLGFILILADDLRPHQQDHVNDKHVENFTTFIQNGTDDLPFHHSVVIVWLNWICIIFSIGITFKKHMGRWKKRTLEPIIEQILKQMLDRLSYAPQYHRHKNNNITIQNETLTSLRHFLRESTGMDMAAVSDARHIFSAAANNTCDLRSLKHLFSVNECEALETFNINDLFERGQENDRRLQQPFIRRLINTFICGCDSLYRDESVG